MRVLPAILLLLALTVAFIASGHVTGPTRPLTIDGLRTRIPEQQTSLGAQLRVWAQQKYEATQAIAGRTGDPAYQLTDEQIAAVAPVHFGDLVGLSVEFKRDALDGLASVLAPRVQLVANYASAAEILVPVDAIAEFENSEQVARVNLTQPPNATVVVSEGVSLHGATIWQSAGFTGVGVKIGILDNSFAGFAALQDANELPSTVIAYCRVSSSVYTSNLDDCDNGGNDHGTAVVETLFDIAPDAEYYISDTNGTIQLRTAVDWMIGQGVDIITHSLDHEWEGYGDGSYFGSSKTLESVDIAIEAGILWLQAAGNTAHLNWQGPWIDADGDGYMEFEGGDELNPLVFTAGQTSIIHARWDGMWGGNTRDVDLHIIDTDRVTVLATSSEAGHSGGPNDIPRDNLFFTAPTAGTYYLALFGESLPTTPAWAQFRVDAGPIPQVMSSQTSLNSPAEGKNPGMLTVGAADWQTPSVIEFFSSRGPTVDGRIKPEIVAADCSSTVTFGPNAFCGTSQSTPHVAGLAALVLQRFPSLTPVELADYLKGNAEPRGTVPNNTWGWGFAQMSPSQSDAPTGVTAVAGSGLATVSWSAPAFDGGGTITGYTVTSNPGGITADVDGVTLSVDVTGLTSGTPYTFTVTTTNAAGTSDPSATSNEVTPTGNTPPTTLADAYGVNEDGTLIVDAVSGVLANDSDPQGDPMTAAEETGPSNGSLTFNSDGSFTYTPSGDFNGIDLFTYVVGDGSATSTPATVTITVNAVNDPPTFTNGADQVATPASGAQSVPGWASAIGTGPADESGDTALFGVSNDDNALFTTQPAISPTGTLTYEPSPTANGVTTVSVQLQDDGGTANGGSDTSPIQTFTITIGPNITGTVALQGVSTGSSSFSTVGPIVTLAPDGGGSVTIVAVAADGTFSFFGVATGTYTITAFANGFQSAERAGPGQAVDTTDITMPATQLRSGLVNGNTVVDGADLSLVIEQFGSITADRTDGLGNWVDLNADGAVSGFDISPVVANLGVFGSKAW